MNREMNTESVKQKFDASKAGRRVPCGSINGAYCGHGCSAIDLELAALRETNKELIAMLDSFVSRLDTHSAPRLAGDPLFIENLIRVARETLDRAAKLNE